MKIIRYYMLVMLITTYSLGMELMLFDETHQDAALLNAALHEAVEDNDVGRVVRLFENSVKPDVNSYNEIGDAPIHSACSIFSEAIVGVLLNNHAKIDALNADGNTGLRL